MKRYLNVLGALIFVAMPLALFAQNKDLDIKLSTTKIVLVDGKETSEPADKAKPGEIIQYSAVYANKSGHALGNLAPTLPIPAGTEFIKDSAKPTPSEATADGHKFEKFPLMHKVKSADGKETEEELPASAYRALRWSAGDLAAGASTTVVARVKITASRPVKLNPK